MNKIDEIRTRLESLKDESWKAGVGKDKFEIVGSDDCITCNNMKNIDFISHSREDILYLFSEIERLSTENEDLRKQYEDADNRCHHCTHTYYWQG